MSKLQLPASVLIGAPLSQEELKKILGGNNEEKVFQCWCSYKTLNGEEAQQQKESIRSYSKGLAEEKCKFLWTNCAASGPEYDFWCDN